MKRIIPIIMAFCFSLSGIMSTYVSAANAAESTTEATESANSAKAVSESSDNESSASNPIGDNSSYYNVKGLKSSPDIVAASAILIDATTGAVLYEKEADTKRYPASITKVMTALLVIENCSMDETVTFSSEAVNGIEAGSSSAGIPVGAKLTVEETLYAMMLVSANEAAAALAEHVSGSIDDFAKLMTERAKELGCTGTQFKNPHGLPDEEHYTTASDMALILKQAMKYESFRTISGADTYTIQSRDTMSDTLELWNHAKILRENSEYYYEYAEGGKTGFTQAALNTLVTFAKKDNVELICVILKDQGAYNSYDDSKALYQWGFKKVKGLNALSDFDMDAAIDAYPNLTDEQKTLIKSLGLTFNPDYYTLTRINFDESQLSTAFTLEEDKTVGVLGYISLNYKDKIIGKTPVTYDITTDNAQKYINTSESSGKSATKKIATTVKKTSKKEILICILSVLVILVVIAIFIRNGVIKLKKKDQKKKEADAIRKNLEENPPTRRRRRK